MKKNRQATKNPNTEVDWGGSIIEAYISEVQNLRSFTQACRLALGSIGVLTEALEIRNEERGFPAKLNFNPTAFIAGMRAESEFCKREVDSGFPTLQSWIVISLWSALESMLRELMIFLLRNHKRFWKGEQISKIKLPIGEFHSMSPSLRAAWVVEQLERASTASVMYSIERFEAPLRAFGLDGKTPKAVSDAIFELGHVRNLFAHNVGKVDNKFRKACPWLSAKLGARLSIKPRQIDLYFYACLSYAPLVLARIAVCVGESDASYLDKVLARIEEMKETMVRG